MSWVEGDAGKYGQKCRLSEWIRRREAWKPSTVVNGYVYMYTVVQLWSILRLRH